MYPYRNNRQPLSNSTSTNNNPQYNPKRRSKQGDWICIRCTNYNYAFRGICNRCRIQTKYQNEQYLSEMGKQNYGQNSFPNAVFFALEPIKNQNTRQGCFELGGSTQKLGKENQLQKGKSEKNINEEFTVQNSNKWIQNLINQ